MMCEYFYRRNTCITNQPPYSLLNSFDFVFDIRNSSVTSQYLSGCAKCKRPKNIETPWPEIPESRELPNISDFTVSKVDADATISVSEFSGGSRGKSSHGLPIQFGYRLWPL